MHRLGYQMDLENGVGFFIGGTVYEVSLCLPAEGGLLGTGLRAGQRERIGARDKGMEERRNW